MSGFLFSAYRAERPEANPQRGSTRLLYDPPMRSNRGLWAIAALVLCATAASCTSGVEDLTSDDERIAGVYASILDWTLDEEPSLSTDEKPEWVLFVASRSEEQIDLDVQVAVVTALEPRVFVRFIDDRLEAVEVDSENEPVRDEGLIVGLGAVAEGESVEVYVDRYRETGDVEAWLVTVGRAGTTWEIVGSPSPTDVRPLPTDG